MLKRAQNVLGPPGKLNVILQSHVYTYTMAIWDLSSTEKTVIAGIAFTNIQMLLILAAAGGAAAYHYHMGPFRGQQFYG